MATQLWAIGLTILATLVGAFGPILIKKGTSKKLKSIRLIITNGYLISGIFVYALSLAIFIPALRGGDVSVIYPIAALMYVWVSFLSVKFLGEKVSRKNWLGVILIIVGVALVGLGS